MSSARPGRRPSAPSRAGDRRNRARSASAWPRHRPRTILQLGLPSGAPGKTRRAPARSDLGVDAPRIDRKAGALGRKAAFRLREAKLVPDEVHQVGGVFAVMDGESRIEADLLGVFAQQPRADAMKGARPGQRVGHDAGIVAQHLRAIRSTRRPSRRPRGAKTSAAESGAGRRLARSDAPRGARGCWSCRNRRPQ